MPWILPSELIDKYLLPRRKTGPQLSWPTLCGSPVEIVMQRRSFSTRHVPVTSPESVPLLQRLINRPSACHRLTARVPAASWTMASSRTFAKACKISSSESCTADASGSLAASGTFVSALADGEVAKQARQKKHRYKIRPLTISLLVVIVLLQKLTGILRPPPAEFSHLIIPARKYAVFSHSDPKPTRSSEESLRFFKQKKALARRAFPGACYAISLAGG